MCFFDKIFSIFSITFLPNNISKKHINRYNIMPKNNGIDKTLYSIAETNFNCKIHIKPRVMPQPKHEIPNKFLIGHKEHLNILVKTYKIAKSTIPALIQCREYFLFFIFSLILYQGLSITISKSTR